MCIVKILQMSCKYSTRTAYVHCVIILSKQSGQFGQFYETYLLVFFVNWSIALLFYWSIGLLVYWSIGLFWSIGILVYWSI